MLVGKRFDDNKEEYGALEKRVNADSVLSQEPYKSFLIGDRRVWPGKNNKEYPQCAWFWNWIMTVDSKTIVAWIDGTLPMYKDGN